MSRKFLSFKRRSRQIYQIIFRWMFDSVSGANNCLDSFLGVNPDTLYRQKSKALFFAVETAVEETLN
jgi:hypothetical protein